MEGCENSGIGFQPVVSSRHSLDKRQTIADPSWRNTAPLQVHNGTFPDIEAADRRSGVGRSGERIGAALADRHGSLRSWLRSARCDCLHVPPPNLACKCLIPSIPTSNVLPSYLLVALRQPPMQ